MDENSSVTDNEGYKEQVPLASNAVLESWSAGHKQIKPRALRIQNIPPSWSSDTLINRIQNATAQRCELISLCRSPFPGDSTQTAVISSQTSLEEVGRAINTSEATAACKLAADEDFWNLTPLSSPNGGDKIEAE